MSNRDITEIMIPRNVQPLRSVSDVIRSIAVAEYERIASLVRVAKIDAQQDAGFDPAHNCVVCSACGEPTDDDGDLLCGACKPTCWDCDKAVDKINWKHQCVDCYRRERGDREEQRLVDAAEVYLNQSLGK